MNILDLRSSVKTWVIALFIAFAAPIPHGSIAQTSDGGLRTPDATVPQDATARDAGLSAEQRLALYTDIATLGRLQADAELTQARQHQLIHSIPALLQTQAVRRSLRETALSGPQWHLWADARMLLTLLNEAVRSALPLLHREFPRLVWPETPILLGSIEDFTNTIYQTAGQGPFDRNTYDRVLASDLAGRALGATIHHARGIPGLAPRLAPIFPASVDDPRLPQFSENALRIWVMTQLCTARQLAEIDAVIRRYLTSSPLEFPPEVRVGPDAAALQNLYRTAYTERFRAPSAISQDECQLVALPEAWAQLRTEAQALLTGAAVPGWRTPGFALGLARSTSIAEMRNAFMRGFRAGSNAGRHLDLIQQH